MVKTTIPQKFTSEDVIILMAFEAKEKDDLLLKLREAAHRLEVSDLAKKLDRLCILSHVRLNRRYLSLCHMQAKVC